MAQTTGKTEGTAVAATATLNVVSVGCLHGDLNRLYENVKKLEEASHVAVDLVLVNGDFEAMRTEKDLDSMACPPKYRHMGDFREYYDGKRRAPYLTVIVGGNHEASSYLSELYSSLPFLIL